MTEAEVMQWTLLIVSVVFNVVLAYQLLQARDEVKLFRTKWHLYLERIEVFEQTHRQMRTDLADLAERMQ